MNKALQKELLAEKAEQKELLAETYEDVQKLIEKTVWRMLARYNKFDFEELVAEANLHYILAFNSFDEDFETRFNTWMTQKIEGGLLEYIRHECRHPRLSVDDENTNIDSLQALSFSVMELLDELGDDAHTTLHLFLDTPKEVMNIALSNGKAHRHLKASLKKHLSNMGWTMRRILKSFEEIQNVLQD